MNAPRLVAITPPEKDWSASARAGEAVVGAKLSAAEARTLADLLGRLGAA